MRAFLLLIGLSFQVHLAAQSTGATRNCNFRTTPEVVQQPSCAGAEDGILRVNLDNPLGLLLTFKWTKLLGIVPLPLPALLSNVATGLSTGDYQVIISNGLCSDTLLINLPEPKPLQILDTAICAINGVVNLKDRIRGGNGDYRIDASSVLGNPLSCSDCNDAIINVNQLSVLNVKVTDRKGCKSERQMAIEVFDSLKANTIVVDETCTENGAITVRATGGSGNYRYALSATEVNPQASSTFAKLRGNRTYPVQVIDVKGCRKEEPTFVAYRPTNTPATLEIKDATCYGAKDGAIAIKTPPNNSVTGYTINNLSDTPQNQPVFNNLKPDTYTVYVLEGADCYVPYQAVINEPDSMSLSASASDANCPGAPDGAVALTANGGNGNYQYSIDGVTYQSSNRFDNLNADTYPAFARDQKGCTAASSFVVNEPESPQIGTNVTASCSEDNTGSIVIIDVGGWIEGEYRFSLDSIRWQTSKIFNELAPDTYTIFVQDPKGCIFKVTAIVPEVQAPAVFFDIQEPSCPDSEDGSITVEVTTNGNTGDYLYSLDSVTFIPQNTFQNLPAGDYRLFMRDSLYCTFAYPFTIAKPGAPIISLNSQNASCFGGKDGQVMIQTQGGRAPFTYALNNTSFQTSPIFTGLGASAYVAIVRDAKGCLFAEEATVAQPSRIQANFTVINETCGNSNGVLACTPSGGTTPYRYRWDWGDTTAVLANVPAGNYRVSISDAHQCLVVRDTMIENLPGPVVVGNLTNSPCHGISKGAIELNIFGGSKPFVYLWSNGLRAPRIDNLQAGDYTVTVTDRNQCTSVETFNVKEPAPMDVQVQTTNLNGLWTIDLQCQGGMAPFTFQWSTGETTEDVSGLKPATYSVTITDRQGCTLAKTISVGTTAAHEPTWASAVRIFPNPATEQLQIHLEMPDFQGTTLALFDINGKNVLPIQILPTATFTLRVAHLPKGVYWLRLEHAEGILHRKVVLQ